VRAHVRPRPHLHIAEPEALDDIRPGWRITSSVAAPMTPNRALALPVVGALLALAMFAPAAPVGKPTPGDVDDLTSTRRADVQDLRIEEASGMAVSRAHPGVVWLINDANSDESVSSDELVFGVDESGRTVAELRLQDIDNRDWEAMAPGVDDSGDPALWIADIGDNDAQWSSIRAYRIPEPKELGRQDVPWRSVELRYPDGPHNAESMMVDESGRIFVATKEGSRAGLYATVDAPAMGTTVELVRLGPVPTFLTDGAISPDGTQVALRSYTSLFLYDAGAFLEKGTDGDSGVVYPLPLQPQGETLAYVLDGESVLVGSEGVSQPIYEIGLPQKSGDAVALPSTDGESGGASLAWGLAAVLLVSGAAVLVMRRRGRVRQPSSPTT
jgi:LPXTG-motif cell wall-anchored protein